MREDFQVSSDVVAFRVDTAPRVVRPPDVREHRAARGNRKTRQSGVPGAAGGVGGGEGQQEFHIRVSWSLESIDWAECLREIQFEYHDSLYNESLYARTVSPTSSGRIDLTIPADKVPCHEDFKFIVKVYPQYCCCFSPLRCIFPDRRYNWKYDVLLLDPPVLCDEVHHHHHRTIHHPSGHRQG